MELKEVLDAVASLGALGFTIIAVYAFATGRVVAREVLDYEREQKEKAYTIAREAMASHDRIADAVEERNRLDRERLAAGRM